MTDLCTFLVARGYSKAFVLKKIQRARLKSREETLTPRPKTSNNRIPMYHPGLNIGGILSHLQPLLHCFDKCKKAIKEIPLMSFQRPKSLGDYLVLSKVKRTHRTEPRSMGTVRCGSGRCPVCQHLEPGDTFVSHITPKYSINYELDCKSSNAVYLISCKVCQIQYVGSTTTKFKFRFNNHKSRL